MSLIRTTIINLVWRKFKLAALVLVATVFAMPTFSATVQEERWFEIEVILFSQLSNKTQLKESFPDQEQQPHKQLRPPQEAAHRPPKAEVR